MKINDKVDFSDTMNLPRKTIATNTNLVKKETFFLARIQDLKRYREVLEKNKSCDTIYNILENPMIINNEIDPTDIQNKILKDMIVRYRLLHGFKVKHNIDFIHVDDMLEPQKENTQKLQEVIKKRDDKQKELTELLKKHVQEIKDLGTAINYSNFNSSTLNHEFESKLIEKFWDLYRKKKIYHDLRPVHWCPHCKRTLENDNIIRSKEEVKNFYLMFNIKYDRDFFKEFNNLNNTYLISNTIRPWILDFESNLAVVEDMEYSLVEVKQKDKNIHYIIATDYVDYIMNTAFFIRYTVKKTFLGKELIGMKCSNVISNTKDLNVIPSRKEYIVLNHKHSSGIAIISSGNTYVDYLVSKENTAVNIKNNLTKDGKTTMLAGNFKNINYKEANSKIIELIKDNMLCMDLVKVRVPKCSKCKENVVYRCELEWYIKKTDDKEKLINCFDSILSKLSDVNSPIKEDIKKKLYDSVNIKENIISNETAFGTPIPVFYCAECSSEVMNEKVIAIIKKMLDTQGIESWYKLTPEEILQGQAACDKCGCSFLFKGTTSLNQFFKLLCLSIVKNDEKSENNKIDICIENVGDFVRKIKLLSFDDERLEDLNRIDKIMLHSKIKIGKSISKRMKEINKAEIDNTKDVKRKTLFGKITKSKQDDNEENEKKNINNSLNSNKEFSISDVVKNYGTDVLRLWCVQNSDQKVSVLSESSILYINKIYKQIRRTLKYLLSNLYDFNPNKNFIEIEKRDDLDKYMYIKLLGISNKIKENYNNLDLYKVYTNVLEFCNKSLCNEYFKVIKYRLYVLSESDFKRRSTQSTLYEIFMSLLEFIEPILPFTFEETWSYIWHKSSEEENNLLLYRNNLKQVNIHDYDIAIKKWNNIFFVITRVNKKIEEEILNKKIKNSLQAKLILGLNAKTKEFVDNNHEDFLRALNVSVLDTKVVSGSSIEVELAPGVECKRCRNYSLNIGEDIKYRYLCPICAKILNNKLK